MKSSFVSATLLLAAFGVQAATITVSPWAPLFKGIEHATGIQQPTQAGERNQRANCLKIDLNDPDVKFFATPRTAYALVTPGVVQVGSLLGPSSFPLARLTLRSQPGALFGPRGMLASHMTSPTSFKPNVLP